REAHRGGRLRVEGLGQTVQTHLLEHAPDAFAQLLAEAEVGAHPRDARVAREADDLARIDDPHQAREPPGALDLDPVVEDLHPDVVPAETVGAMYDRVDDALDPSRLRHQTLEHEAPLVPEHASHGFESAYRPQRGSDHVGDRTVAGNV